MILIWLAGLVLPSSPPLPLRLAAWGPPLAGGEPWRLLTSALVHGSLSHLALNLVFLVQAGWAVAEVGRQPWIVYHVMRTSDAVSRSLAPVQVILSLGALTALYAVLGAVDIYLLTKFARKGPELAAKRA